MGLLEFTSSLFGVGYFLAWSVCISALSLDSCARVISLGRERKREESYRLADCLY
jgi:hypothetical protein